MNAAVIARPDQTTSLLTVNNNKKDVIYTISGLSILFSLWELYSLGRQQPKWAQCGGREDFCNIYVKSCKGILGIIILYGDDLTMDQICDPRCLRSR